MCSVMGSCLPPRCWPWPMRSYADADCPTTRCAALVGHVLGLCWHPRRRKPPVWRPPVLKNLINTLRLTAFSCAKGVVRLVSGAALQRRPPFRRRTLWCAVRYTRAFTEILLHGYAPTMDCTPKGAMLSSKCHALCASTAGMSEAQLVEELTKARSIGCFMCRHSHPLLPVYVSGACSICGCWQYVVPPCFAQMFRASEARSSVWSCVKPKHGK